MLLTPLSPPMLLRLETDEKLGQLERLPTFWKVTLCCFCPRPDDVDVPPAMADAYERRLPEAPPG